MFEEMVAQAVGRSEIRKGAEATQVGEVRCFGIGRDGRQL